MVRCNLGPIKMYSFEKKMVRVNQPSLRQLEAEPRSPETRRGLNVLLCSGNKAMGSFSEHVNILCNTTRQSDIEARALGESCSETTLARMKGN